jgi:ribulose-5-phosphate 4-epimerase/fuculose-1-phosphate aldolase
MPTKAKKRMDKLMRHLTAQPAEGNLSPSANASTPHRQNIRRQLASAQKERLIQEYGYELQDEANDPLVQHVDDNEELERNDGKKRARFSFNKPQEPSIIEDIIITESRAKLAHACRLAQQYNVAGTHLNDDMASVYIPGQGYLYKPLTLRFDEVTPEKLAFSKSLDDLPKLHADLYATNSRNNHLCVFSCCNENCELVAITKDGLLPLCQDSLRVYGRIKKTDDVNLGARAARSNFRDVSCWLVKNRGTVCTGKSIEASLANLVFTVRACTFQVRALGAVGGDLARLDIMSESAVIHAKTELQDRCSDEQASQNLFKRA